MVRTSKTMLNESGKGAHLCLVPDLRRNALFFTIENYICCGFVVNIFHYVELGSLYACFLDSRVCVCVCVLILNRHWILSRAFSVPIEIIIWFLFFVNMAYPVDWLAYIEEALYSLIKSILIMVYITLLIFYWSVCASWCFLFCFWGFLHLCL